MLNVSRRTFLSAAAAAPIAGWSGQRGLGQDAAPRVRYDARHPKGVEMLKIYAAAVRKMKDPKQTPEGDPRSWLFQWYSHFVNGDTTKAAEIARVYTKPGDPHRAVAEAMWDMCQAHSAGQVEDYFLPWHRAFVLHFEQIVAAVSGRPEFTLPYWNYSTTDPTIRGVIPPQFTKEHDPVFGPLFDGLRNPGVNAGQPIQKGQPGDPLNLDALKQATYSRSGAAAGFNQTLDFGLHGNIHVLVGGGKNMGSVPYAARDPIFWLHHCNIDRLWASWVVGGHVNPPPANFNKTFTFANGQGKPVLVNLGTVLDFKKLNYTYEYFERVPGPAPRAMLAADIKTITEPVAAAPQAAGVALTAAATKVTLAPAAQAPTVTARMTAVAPGKSVYLVASDLKAKAQPGVLYHLYLDLPEGATGQEKEDHYVGTINFFGGHVGAHGNAQPHDAPKEVTAKFISFDVTGVVRALGETKSLKDQPVLSIIPQGKAEDAAEPVVGKIELVVQ